MVNRATLLETSISEDVEITLRELGVYQRKMGGQAKENGVEADKM